MRRFINFATTIALLLSPVGTFAGEAVLIHYNSIPAVSGSGNRITQVRNLREFTRIQSNLAAEIIVTTGGGRSIKVTFDDNIIDLINTTVKGMTLHINVDGSYQTREECLIEISVPFLTELSASGSETISLDVAEGNYLTLNLDGSGNVTASGEIDMLEINLSGKVSVDSRGLKASTVLASLDGMGNIQLYAASSFEGQVKGWGNIIYYGQPASTSATVSGVGEIRPGK